MPSILRPACNNNRLKLPQIAKRACQSGEVPNVFSLPFAGREYVGDSNTAEFLRSHVGYPLVMGSRVLSVGLLESVGL